MKPAPVAGFIFNNEKLAKSLPKIFHYRKPKVVHSKSGTYIEDWENHLEFGCFMALSTPKKEGI